MSGGFAHPMMLGSRLESTTATARCPRRTAYDSAAALGAALQARFRVDARRHRLHVPREAHGLHGADGVPREIELPPVEAVARGALIAVVVVVPALADGEKRGDRVVRR